MEKSGRERKRRELEEGRGEQTGRKEGGKETAGGQKEKGSKLSMAGWETRKRRKLSEEVSGRQKREGKCCHQRQKIKYFLGEMDRVQRWCPLMTSFLARSRCTQMNSPGAPMVKGHILIMP